MKSTDENYRQIISEIEDYAILLLDENGLVKDWNKGAEKLKGYSAEEIIGRDFKLFYTKEDLSTKLPDRMIQRAMAEGKAMDEGWRVRKDGSRFWGSVLLTALYDKDRHTGFLKITRDLSQRKELEDRLLRINDKLELRIKDGSEKLAVTENQLRMTLDNMFEGVQIHDFDWRYIYVNDALVRHSTYQKKEELLGHTLTEIYPGIEHTDVFRVMQRCMYERVTEHLEIEFEFPNGTKADFDLSIQPVPEGIFILSVDITEKKKAREALRRSEMHYRMLVEQSADGIFVSDAQGNYTDVNIAGCRMMGYSREELLSLHLTDLLSEAEFPRLAGIIEEFAEGKTVTSEWQFKRKDGSLFPGELIGRALPDGSMQGILRDITERKKAQQKIMKVNRLYAFISQVNQSIVQINDEQQLIDKVCDIAIEFGKFKMAWIGKVDEQRRIKIAGMSGENNGIMNFRQYEGFDYEDPVLSNTLTSRALRTGKYAVNNDISNDPAFKRWEDDFIRSGAYSGISLPITRSGRIAGFFTLVASDKDFFDEDEIKLLEEAAGDVSFALDNFDKEKRRHLAEQLLRQSEARLNRAQRVAHLGSWEIDLATDTALWSDETCRIFGLPAEQNILSSKDFLISSIHPDDLAEVSEKIRESYATLSDITLEHRIIRRDGTVRYIHTERYFEFDKTGAPVTLFGITQDITDRKESEKLVSDNFALFRGLFESAPEAVFIGDCDTNRFLDCNANAVALFGYSHEDLLEMNPVILSPEFQPDGSHSGQRAGEMIGRALTGESVIFEWVHLNAAGREIDCEVRLTRLDLPGRNLVRGSVIDISEKKLAEKKLQRANRLYAFISAVNQSIVHTTDEQQLLDGICRIAMEIGKFNMAWIGLVDEARKLNVVSAHGNEIGVSRMHGYSGMSIDEPLIKDLPTGIALRTGANVFCNDMQNDTIFAFWKDEFIRQGVNSTISLPIFRSGKVAGLFNLQAIQKNFFDEEEIKLLAEAADDISFALDNFDKEKKRHLTEQKLQKSESNLRTIFDNTDVGLLLLDMDYNIMDCNWLVEEWSKISMGLVFEKGMKLKEKLDQQRLVSFERIMTMLQNSGHVNIETHYVDTDKALYWFNVNARPVIGSDGGMLGVCLAVTNITEKKLAEKRREFDRSNLHALINNTSDYLWSVDRDFRLITFNQPLFDTLRQITGRELTSGADMLSFALSKEQASLYKGFYERAFAGEAFTEIEYWSDPDESWSEISFYPIREGDAIIGSACHSRNITTSQKDALRIEESEKKYRHLFYDNPLPLAIIEYDTFRFLDVNHAIMNQYGYSRDEFLTMTAYDLRPDKLKNKFVGLEEAHATGMHHKGSLTHLKKDGTAIDVEVSSAGIVFEDLDARLALIMDVTEKRKAENEIRELNEHLEERVQERTAELSEANKALEAFSYSVSHDLRAPVRAVLGFTSIIKEEHSAAMDPEVKELFSFIEENGARMNAIIEDLLKLAKYGKETLRPERVDMTALVESVWANISRASPHHAVLDLSRLPVIEADMSMMQQVVINLLSNAIKYSAKKESPMVTVWAVTQEDFATFYFKDNGAGFDMKYYKTLFRAFQRLHSDRDFEGTGVGLALVKRIIDKHGGTIGAEARVEEGATFYITLPSRSAHE